MAKSLCKAMGANCYSGLKSAPPISKAASADKDEHVQSLFWRGHRADPPGHLCARRWRGRAFRSGYCACLAIAMAGRRRGVTSWLRRAVLSFRAVRRRASFTQFVLLRYDSFSRLRIDRMADDVGRPDGSAISLALCSLRPAQLARNRARKCGLKVLRLRDPSLS